MAAPPQPAIRRRRDRRRAWRLARSNLHLFKTNRKRIALLKTPMKFNKRRREGFTSNSASESGHPLSPIVDFDSNLGLKLGFDRLLTCALRSLNFWRTSGSKKDYKPLVFKETEDTNLGDVEPVFKGSEEYLVLL